MIKHSPQIGSILYASWGYDGGSQDACANGALHF